MYVQRILIMVIAATKILKSNQQQRQTKCYAFHIKELQKCNWSFTDKNLKNTANKWEWKLSVSCSNQNFIVHCGSVGWKFSWVFDSARWKRKEKTANEIKIENL